MPNYIDKAQLQVDPILVDFVENELLPDLHIDSEQYWRAFAALIDEFGDENRALLAKRESIQAHMDNWCETNGGQYNFAEYKAFLYSIGYLHEEGEDFCIGTDNVDTEIALQAAPQLVVPTSNARFALNATNARWGSLYDALYGTDAIASSDGAEAGSQYNPIRGAKVIQFGRRFLDSHFALRQDSHMNAVAYRIHNSALLVELESGETVELQCADACVGFVGNAQKPDSIILKNKNLHVIIEIDSQSDIGRIDKAGVKDICLEAAATTIQDFEDSVAAVDAEDKVGVYKNWLGLMRGSLHARFEKSGKWVTRSMQADKSFTALDGSEKVLHGRSLLFARNVGHLMSNPAIIDASGHQVQEGIMDAMISVTAALYDLRGINQRRNSRTGSVYIVKPKMHGPEEAEFANRLFNRVEDALGLARYTVKIGVMDEERRTTVNLKECIRQVKDRVVFINTGFLDRTGDEIHTSMRLGPMALKAEIKKQPWIQAYEDWNVDIGLELGFQGKAQIGKGMWAMPDEMAKMLQEKIAHPQAGANTAWVPSPIGAVLHAMHYHQVDVSQVQTQLKTRPRAALDDILTVPLLQNRDRLTPEQIENELENNAQGILGYVVRWIDQGVGCSKVPDIHHVGLMEDRATLRISSQHICNWLHHGICTKEQVLAVFERMAKVVDTQNQHDANYEAMAPDFDNNLAFEVALALVFQGETQPSGYTEPLLHQYRLKLKANI